MYNLTDEEKKRKMDALKVYNNLVLGGTPYYENILTWLKTMPDYDFNTETFYGAPL